MVLNPSQFVKWRNHEQNFPTLYDSGLAHASVLDVPLGGPGTYYLVFDNTFSIMSSKNVAGDVRLIYDR